MKVVSLKNSPHMEHRNKLSIVWKQCKFEFEVENRQARHAFIAWFSSSIICTFHSSMKSRPRFTWSWVKNLIAEPGFDPQWKQVWTQPEMSCNLVKIHINKSNPYWGRSHKFEFDHDWVWPWLNSFPIHANTPLNILCRNNALCSISAKRLLRWDLLSKASQAPFPFKNRIFHSSRFKNTVPRFKNVWL